MIWVQSLNFRLQQKDDLSFCSVVEMVVDGIVARGLEGGKFGKGGNRQCGGFQKINKKRRRNLNCAAFFEILSVENFDSEM